MVAKPLGDFSKRENNCEEQARLVGRGRQYREDGISSEEEYSMSNIQYSMFKSTSLLSALIVGLNGLRKMALRKFPQTAVVRSTTNKKVVRARTLTVVNVILGASSFLFRSQREFLSRSLGNFSSRRYSRD
jgi:hypothetical protein